MMDVERYLELKAMSEDELRKLAESLGLRWPSPLGYADILAAEASREDPDRARRLRENIP